jgi:hypothetical protein
MAHQIPNALNPKSGLKYFGGAVTYDRRNLVLQLCHTGILSLNPLKLPQQA